MDRTNYPIIQLGRGTEAWREAAFQGNLDYIKYFHKCNLPDYNNTVMDTAAKYGRLDVLKWLYNNKSEGYTCNIACLAICNGHQHVVEWIHSNITNAIYTDTAINIASSYGYIHIVKFLYKNRKEYNTRHDWVKDAINRSSMNGYIDLVKYLFSLNIHTICNRATINLSTSLFTNEIKLFLLEKSIRRIMHKMWLYTRKRKIRMNQRNKMYYYVHIDILSKPPNFLGSTIPGLLYKNDMENEILE